MLTLKRVPERETRRIADILDIEVFEDEDLFVALDGDLIVGFAI